MQGNLIFGPPKSVIGAYTPRAQTHGVTSPHGYAIQAYIHYFLYCKGFVDDYKVHIVVTDPRDRGSAHIIFKSSAQREAVMTGGCFPVANFYTCKNAVTRGSSKGKGKGKGKGKSKGRGSNPNSAQVTQRIFCSIEKFQYLDDRKNNPQHIVNVGLIL